MTRVAHAGVGGWGKNVVRVVGELAELAWICDTDEERLSDYAERLRAFAEPKAETDRDGRPYRAQKERRR